MSKFTPYDPHVVLAIGAHADDIDFGASGSIASWAAAGAEVHYLVITDGSKGSSDRNITKEQLVTTRQQEQRDAAASLGAREVHFLNYEDGALENTQALKKDICRIIRQVKPDTVVTFDPSELFNAEAGIINHPDHRAVGQATLDAVYPLARDHLSFPELLRDEQLEPHKVAHLLLMNFTDQNYHVNITTTLDAKLAALTKHASQIPSLEKMAQQITDLAIRNGQKAGYQYAEGFIRIDCPE